MAFLEYLKEKGYPSILLTKICTSQKDYIYKFRVKGKLQIAPKWELKILQKILKDYLTENYSSNISQFATAYIKNKNISYNVSKHFAKNYFYVTDFTNFFPSIKLTITEKYLSDLLNLEDSDSLKTIFKIVFYENSLQYGFPTSPIISNMIMSEFDNLLNDKLNTIFSNNIAYSRYCDDITISTKHEFQNNEIRKAISDVIIDKYNFLLINEKKTRSFEKYSHYPYITGLVPLRDRVTIGKKKFNRVKLNIYLHLSNKPIQTVDLFDTEVALSSYLSYIYLVDPHNYNRLKEHSLKRFQHQEITRLFKK